MVLLVHTKFAGLQGKLIKPECLDVKIFLDKIFKTRKKKCSLNSFHLG